jgi:chaperonin cofactor prefoldin
VYLLYLFAGLFIGVAIMYVLTDRSFRGLRTAIEDLSIQISALRMDYNNINTKISELKRMFLEFTKKND